ncbi:hypothetical protein HZA42_02890 [Candidatus Peregrinibacteria bacterium]|nr:hypothetical protein [Candidatus Peregrinibacteria bacterium]
MDLLQANTRLYEPAPPEFKPYEGPGRKGDSLYGHVTKLQAGESVETGLTDGVPRFRIEDTREAVGNLIRAAMRDQFGKDIFKSPYEDWGTMGRKEAEDTSKILAWFNGLPEADFAGFFPRGTAANDTSRRDDVADSFEKAHKLIESGRDDGLIQLRTDLLSGIRGILGDRSFFVPRELKNFARFRMTDSLDYVRKLAAGNCYATAIDNDKERRKSLVTLGLRLSVSPEEIFENIAEISGLDKRHR